MTLAEFLLARIAEDEAAAQLVNQTIGTEPEEWIDSDGSEVTISAFPTYKSGHDVGELEFMHRFGPLRVLAECEAKRRIVEWHEDLGAGSSDGYHACSCMDGSPGYWPCDTLRLLALPYADHPDYLTEWTPA